MKLTSRGHEDKKHEVQETHINNYMVDNKILYVVYMTTFAPENGEDSKKKLDTND